MAKKDENLEVQQAAEQAAAAQVLSETPNRDKWLANLRGKYGEDKSEEELYDLSMSGYDAEHEAVKRYNEEANALDEILKTDPSLAMVFNGIFERGKDGNPFGALRDLPEEAKRYITDDNYGDEEYLAARKAREDEEAAKVAKDEQTQALREQAFNEVCTEDGVADPEAALSALQDIFNNPCETLEQCKEQVRAFLKMVDYDTAVQAAEVRGRNANIAAQRKKKANASDGMVNGSSAAGVAPRANEKANSITDMANRRAAMRNL